MDFPPCGRVERHLCKFISKRGGWTGCEEIIFNVNQGPLWLWTHNLQEFSSSSDPHQLTFYLTYILTFYLAFFLAFYLTYIPTFYLAFYRAFYVTVWRMFWHSIWHSILRFIWHFIWQIFWHSIWHLASSPTFYLVSTLASILTFYLAYVRVHACPTASGARENARVQRAPTQQDLSMSFWHVLSSGSIGAHSHNQLAEGGGGEGGVAPLLKSRDPHLAGWEIVISHVSQLHAFLLASIPYNIYTYTCVYPSMYKCVCISKKMHICIRI